jgi:hypothetical protein
MHAIRQYDRVFSLSLVEQPEFWPAQSLNHMSVNNGVETIDGILYASEFSKVVSILISGPKKGVQEKAHEGA